jgi:hypothetical protein
MHTTPFSLSWAENLSFGRVEQIQLRRPRQVQKSGLDLLVTIGLAAIHCLGAPLCNSRPAPRAGTTMDENASEAASAGGCKRYFRSRDYYARRIFVI